MSIHKYRSVSEMPPPERCDDRDLPARIRSVWDRAFLFCPPVRHVGVRRFRSMEEANQARLRDTAELMKQRATRR